MWWLLPLPAVVALAMTAANLATWTRGRHASAPPRSVSILIPARDEEAHIETCVRAALALEPLEVVVYDDHSTDGTAGILGRLQRADPRLRVLRGPSLPPGWIGKPHACHRLAEAARGEVLLFVDADTVLALGALRRVGSILRRRGADVVTAVPRQRMGSRLEGLMMPLLHVTYVSWLPLALVHLTRDPRVLAANGQVLAIRAASLRALGGFGAIRDCVVDDMALCRAAKKSGMTVVFADGSEMATTRMYDSGGALWAGFSKNIFEGLGGSLPALLGVIVLYLWSFVLPWLVLPAALLWGSGATAPAAVGVLAAVAQRLLLAARMGHPVWSALAQPVAVVGLIAIALNSWRWSRAGTIVWSGRTYPARHQRRADA